SRPVRRSCSDRDIPRTAGRNETRLEKSITAIVERPIHLRDAGMRFSLVDDCKASDPVQSVRCRQRPFLPDEFLFYVRELNFERKLLGHFADVIEIDDG